MDHEQLDRRAGKVALLCHCLVNQNAKVRGAPAAPAMAWPLVEALARLEIGIMQLPCPECACLGLDRPLGDDTREQYDTPAYHRVCAELAVRTVDEVERYRNSGYTVVGLLGVEGSPSCSVNRVPTRAGPAAGPGLFIEAVRRELSDRSMTLPLLGVPERASVSGALAELDRLAAQVPGPG